MSVASVVSIDDRFVEISPSNDRERERREEGWLFLRDRATGRVFTIWAPDLESALWCQRALNAADRTEDRLSEPNLIDLMEAAG